MKKIVLLLLAALLGMLPSAFAYDFSAVAPSGQTLYFKICGSNVTVTYPGSSSTSPYYHFSRPTGNLVIPSSVINNSISYPVTCIGDSAFSNCSGLTSVTIPTTVSNISNYAFYYCTGLTSMTIPNSVTSIGAGTFYGCRNLISVAIPNTITSVGDYTFCFCYNMTSISLPSSIISIGNSAFRECDSLTSVIIPNSTISIGNCAFEHCVSLTSVTIPSSVISIGHGAFKDCTGLISVAIPSTVSSLSEYIFFSCSSLTSVSIPSSVTSIGNHSFGFCSSLSSIIIHDLVTSIGSQAFQGCTGLTSITIGRSVSNIGHHAFTNCTLLDSVFLLPHNVPTLGVDAFYGTTPTLYVQCDDYNEYISTTVWSSFNYEAIYPNINIDLSHNDTSRGYVSIIPQNGYNITCDSITIVHAVANNGFHFTQWNDGITTNPRTLVLTQDTSITAFFDRNSYSVTGSSSQITYGNVTGSDTVYYLDTVILTATANYGYHFVRWNDYNTDNPRMVIATDNINLTAIFDYNQYTITAVADTSIHGNCTGGGCYNYLSSRTIHANANYGYHFVQWNDGVTDNPRIITLTCDTAFIAYFAPNQYTLTIQCNDESLGIITGGGIYNYHDTITLSATPIEHHHLVKWQWYSWGYTEESIENPLLFVVQNDATITAYFAIDTHIVNVVSSDIARGMVESSGTQFVYGTPCTLTAMAYTGYTFAGWSNGVTANPYTFAVLNDVELTALFIAEGEEVYTVTVVSADPMMGTVSGGGQALYGGEVTIHAIPNEGYRFLRWNDNDTNAERTITVTANTTYTAYFESITHGITDIDKVNIRVYIVDGRIHVSIDGEPVEELYVYDLMGRKVFHATHADGTSALPGGVYLVKVDTLPAHKVVVIR